MLKTLKHNDVTNTSRIESLENWVISQGDLIKKLEDTLSRIDANGDIIKEITKISVAIKRIISLEIDYAGLKLASASKDSLEIKELKKKKE